LFLTAVVPCRYVSQGIISGRGSRANFVIGINNPQGSVERTESACDLLCDICGSDIVLAIPLRNWSVLAGNERYTSSCTYLAMPPAVHLYLWYRRDSLLTGGE